MVGSGSEPRSRVCLVCGQNVSGEGPCWQELHDICLLELHSDAVGKGVVEVRLKASYAPRAKSRNEGARCKVVDNYYPTSAPL